MRKKHHRFIAIVMGMLILFSMACTSSRFVSDKSGEEKVQPKKWDVSIVNVEKSKKFGTWEFSESDDGEFLILTIHYKNVTDKRQAFSPQSLILLFPENTDYDGNAMLPMVYQSDNASYVYKFIDGISFFDYLEPGEERTEWFAWEILVMENEDYVLLFPETCAIEFQYYK